MNFGLNFINILELRKSRSIRPSIRYNNCLLTQFVLDVLADSYNFSVFEDTFIRIH